MNQYKPFPAKTIPELRHTLVSYHRRVTPTLWTHAKSRVARTLAKRGRPLPPVKVVTLRPTEPASEQGRGQGRKLTKRVEVGAYWRRRPHATGDGPEDMVWVCGHERGPEDALASGGVVVKRVR